MKIVFLFLVLVLVTVNAEQLLRDDEADERDDALSPFEVFEDIEDIEDIEDRAAKKQKKTKKTKKTKKASTTGDDGDIQGIDERGDALAPFEVFEDIEDIEDRAEVSDRGDFNKSYTTGKMIQLGKYYKSGIALKVLYTFDTDFIKMFGAAGMKTLIELTKKNLDSKSGLKKLIGTTIKMTGTTRKYSKAFTDKGKTSAGGWCKNRMGVKINKGDWPCTFSTDAPKQKQYDVYQYVQGKPKTGGGGVSYGATVCNSNKDQRISMIMTPTASDMKSDKITDTKANRLKKLASTSAHEIGHTLGMPHDFTDPHRRGTPYTYRKYDGKSCAGGFMSYVNQGKNGFSSCSARDMSRYLTKGGTTKPCTFGGSKSSSTTSSSTTSTGKACTAACAKKFKSSCMAWVRNFGASCAQAYSNCRGKLNNGDPMLLREGCTKACKSTKTMLAYKSKC